MQDHRATANTEDKRVRDPIRLAARKDSPTAREAKGRSGPSQKLRRENYDACG